MKKREEVRLEDTWDLTHIFSSDQEWENMYEKTRQNMSGYDSFKGQLKDSSEVLLNCLKFDEALSWNIERLYVYAKQKSDQDTGNHQYQEYASRAQTLSNQASEQSSYIVPEILEIPQDVLKRYQDHEPGLKPYERTIQIILNKKAHTLSASMEELLARSCDATQNASNIFSMFNNADVKFPKVMDEHGNQVELSHGNFVPLLESKERKVRKDTFQALYGVYKQFSNTLSAVFESNIKQAVFYSKVRNYPSSRSYYLSQNEIPEQVYDNLIKVVHKHLPVFHQYIRVRKEVLKVEELHPYDLYTPMTQQVEKKISFEEAVEMVKKGLKPLGEEYLSVLQEGFDNRWIDVYENEGKRSGAYSWGTYGTHPYVLLNYNQTLDHVFTLAHEMGHALHSYFSDKHQNYMNAGYKIFVAEVASTCNEALLIRHMLNHSSDKSERAYLINHFLDSFRGTLFRQTMFAEFEALVHQKTEEGVPLTSRLLCQMYRELNETYFGPELAVDSELEYEWSRIPHFYTPFYVYQYATGFSAAIAISSKILSGDQAALDGYFKFLSGGNSLPPIELLKLCGVDMSTSHPVDEALEVFKQLLKEFRETID